MRDEIAVAVVFLTRLIKKNEKLKKEKIEQFSNTLSAILVEKFKNHWYRDKPNKGQGYRCIRVNEMEPVDPVLEKAAADCELKYEDLNLPPELTLWVDPDEVCCRFGESKGSYCTLASFKTEAPVNKAHVIDLEPYVVKQRKPKTVVHPSRSTNRGHHANSSHGNNNQESLGSVEKKSHHSIVNTKSNYQNNNSGKVCSKFNPHKSKFHLHNQHKNSQHMFSHPPPPIKPYRYNHYQPPFNPRSQGPDRYHWVRGADLVKA